MKKVALFVTAIAVTAITLVSCSKKGDYTCVCTVNGVEAARVTWTDMKKSDAEKACNQQVSSGGANMACNLQ